MRASLLGVALLLAAALTGCDDVLLFDVGHDGRLLASCDALGRTAAIGDGSAPRHLAWIDPTTGDVERITSSTLALSWPRACGHEVIAVLERTRLVTLPAGRELLALDSGARERRLDQPTPSPTAAHVAVLASTRLGVPGTLKVISVETAKVVLEVEHAFLGFAWTEDGALLVPVATAPRAEPLDPGPGEVVRVRLDGGRETLVRATFAGVTWLGSAGARGLAVLPLGEASGPIGLAGFSLDKPGARRGDAAGVCDLWPTIDGATGRVLFTRARPEKPSLEGELRLGSLDDLARSAVVPTTGPAVAPRWLAGGRVAYLTPDDRLVVQDLDGSRRQDLSASLKAACFGDSK